MEYFQSSILALIQGITEFLPISSSGHLVLVPYIFNWDYRGLSFDVALHFGTVIAIIAFFWKDWLAVSKNAFGFKKLKADSQKPKATNLPANLLWQIIIASIPAAIVGFLINGYIESSLQSPLLIAVNLIFFGLLLWLSDKISKKSRQLSAISYKLSFAVGLMQSIALIPGVSRSGITMTGARFAGLGREDSARFSFLLGTPAMIGAALFESIKFDFSSINPSFILAIIVSAITGFLAIKYLIEYLKRGNFAVFAIYRIVLAVIVLLFYFLIH